MLSQPRLRWLGWLQNLRLPHVWCIAQSHLICIIRLSLLLLLFYAASRWSQSSILIFQQVERKRKTSSTPAFFPSSNCLSFFHDGYFYFITSDYCRVIGSLASCAVNCTLVAWHGTKGLGGNRPSCSDNRMYNNWNIHGDCGITEQQGLSDRAAYSKKGFI